MRLFAGKVTPIAEELVRSLTDDQHIEVVKNEEVQLDVEAVLKEYLRVEREVTDEAKQRMEHRGLSFEQLGKVKQQVAKERGAPPMDEVLPYLVQQILDMLFHSQNVEEIFADDKILRTKTTVVLKKHMDVEGDLDKEVRSKIRNLEDGTAAFDVEYAKVMDQIKRKRGLT